MTATAKMKCNFTKCESETLICEEEKMKTDLFGVSVQESQKK